MGLLHIPDYGTGLSGNPVRVARGGLVNGRRVVASILDTMRVWIVVPTDYVHLLVLVRRTLDGIRKNDAD